MCEIKFSKHPIGAEVIAKLQQKIDRLKRPKGFSCRSVLIHLNGVSEGLFGSDYFSSIVNMTIFHATIFLFMLKYINIKNKITGNKHNEQ